MSAIVVVGSQWGDEGKGKVVDVFSAEADYVVRYQGGANAGHTLVVNGIKTVLHLVPSGVLHPSTRCLISSGVVVDVEQVAKEIHALKETGYLKDPGQLKIADSATVILPYHRVLDQAREKAANHEKLGTTGRGIGPAYEERASRKAILFGDLYKKDTLRHKLERALEEKNFLIEKFYGLDPIKLEDLMDHIERWAEELAPHRCADASSIIHTALKGGKKVLFEGAQGALLDIFHGTYPFVTSSSTIAGSACVGSGVGPCEIDKVLGITKAYTTRVGSGPFPTELDDETGEKLRKDGHEFGATTGRTRRCGWLDLVALRYAIRTNGITNIALMKMDVLSGHKEIKVCVAYELDGEQITDMPVLSGDLERATPIYKTLPGWDEPLDKAKSMSELPRNASNYVNFIINETGTPVDVVSVGPGREQTLWINQLFT